VRAGRHVVLPASNPLWSFELDTLLDETVAFIGRFVVLGEAETHAIALWNAHTYVYEAGSATPYLHPYSAEPGSGKTTLLDVLALTVRNPIQADNVSEAVLFRLVDSLHPTLLFDEVDAVFSKRSSDATEGIRQILNSGYRRGKQVWRCVGRSHEVKAFDVYCPKATAGLYELPRTLAHRSIPIEMKPPRQQDVYEDLDLDEADETAAALRSNLRMWAEESFDVIGDRTLKPPKLPQLDARANEIWQPLFRIADQGGCEWSARARQAAVELSSGSRREADASVSVRLLGHIRDVFKDERMTCQQLVDALNTEEDLPYGGWNGSDGVTTRELGRKLAPYGIHAKSIRIRGERVGNGYERGQFDDAWSRYLRVSDLDQYSGTTGTGTRNTAPPKPVRRTPVPDPATDSIPDEQADVPVVPVNPPVEPLRLLTESELRRLDVTPIRQVRKSSRGEL
jgi:hypothetical protein